MYFVFPRRSSLKVCNCFRRIYVTHLFPREVALSNNCAAVLISREDVVARNKEVRKYRSDVCRDETFT